ncbi:MAG: hypothetical protein Q8L22_03325 [Reyranella sp.]|nr:hypothetical protein [Reyranella sp.]
MALDIHVGSLTRYYGSAGNRVAAVAESPDHLHPAVLAWRSALSERLGDNIAAPLDWDETPGAPHFKGRLDWGGLAALVLWAAYAEHPGLRRASLLPDEWERDPALARSKAEGFRSRYSHIVRNVELWLPSAFLFTFESEDVGGHRVVVGSVPTLLRQLIDLNDATWKADAAAVKEWGRRSPPDDAPLELRARYGFAAMVGAARQAARYRLPMKLDC